jgi:hypothetical protein
MKLFLIFIFCFSLNLEAIGLDPYDIDFSDNFFKQEENKKEEKNDDPFTGGFFSEFTDNGFMFFPLYISSENTSTAGGISSLYYFKRKGDMLKSRFSYVGADVLVGNNSFFNFKFKTNHYISKNKHNIYAYVGFNKNYSPYFNYDNYLGDYKEKTFYLYLNYRRLISSNIYLGGFYDFSYSDINSSYMGNLKKSGIGFTLGNLYADKVFTHWSGFYFEIKNAIYLKALGSTGNHSRHVVDLRHFLKFLKYHVLSFNFLSDFNFGTVPYLYRPSLGSYLRAFPNGMYNGKQTIILRSEYKFVIFSNAMLAGFFSFGYNGEDINDLRLDKYVTSYGGGIRVLFDARLGLNLRLDYARGTNKSDAFILTVGESF